MSSRKKARKQIRTQEDFIEELGIQNRTLWTVLSAVARKIEKVHEYQMLEQGLPPEKHYYPVVLAVSAAELHEFRSSERWVVLIPMPPNAPGGAGFTIILPPAPVEPPFVPPAAARSGGPDSLGTDPTQPSQSTTDTSR